MTLAYDFPLYSPGSRELADFESAGEMALLEAEAQRTAAELVRELPARVGKGQLTEAEARAAIASFECFAAELALERAYYTARPITGDYPLPRPITPATPAAWDAANLLWEGRVETLRAEILRRRAGWPALIGKGGMAPGEAGARLSAIEALHELYWCRLFAWPSPNGPAPADDRPAYQAWAAPVRAHAAALQAAAVNQLSEETAA